MDKVVKEKEVTYLFSLNYNINYPDDEVVETRTIKREYKGDTSKLLQYLKAEARTYSVKEAANRVLKVIGTESSLTLSNEITPDQFEKFMEESCELFSVDLSKLNLH